jgi:hypothetical protein
MRNMNEHAQQRHIYRTQESVRDLASSVALEHSNLVTKSFLYNEFIECSVVNVTNPNNY